MQSRLPTSLIHKVNHQLERLLHFDFVPLCPVEVSHHIFSFLDHTDVLNAAAVSKAWYRLSTAPALWRTLYFKQRWRVNERRVREFETWARQVSSTHAPLAALPEAYHAGYFWRSPEPGSPIALNWAYLYRQHRRLDRNWLQGYHTQSRIAPAPLDPAEALAGGQQVLGIYSLQFDSTRVVTGSRDCKVRVWDLETKQCIRTMIGHKGSVLCLQFDDRSNTVVTGSSDTTIMTWDISTGRARHVYRGHTDAVLNVRFDDKWVISSSKDRTIRIWSRQEGTKHAHTCVRILHGHEAAVNGIQYMNGLIVSAGGDHSIRVWNFETGECIKKIRGHERGIACIYFDGTYITSGSSDLSIRVFELATGQLVRQYKGHDELIRTIQKDHRKIVSGSYDTTIKIWNLDPTFPGLLPPAPFASPTGSDAADQRNLPPQMALRGAGTPRRASMQLDHTVQPLTGAAGGANHGGMTRIDLGRHNSRVFKLQFDETRIISCSQDSEIFIWDFARGVDRYFF